MTRWENFCDWIAAIEKEMDEKGGIGAAKARELVAECGIPAPASGGILATLAKFGIVRLIREGMTRTYKKD